MKYKKFKLLVISSMILLGIHACNNERMFTVDPHESIVIASKSCENLVGEKIFFYKQTEDDKVWHMLEHELHNLDYEEGFEYKLAVEFLPGGDINVIRVLDKYEAISEDVPIMKIKRELSDPKLETFDFEGENYQLLDDGIIKVDTLYVLDHDVVMGESQFASMVPSKAGYGIWNHHYWSSGVVHYTYASGFSFANIIEEAMEMISNATGLSFIYGTSYNGYIEFINGSGAYSTAIGKTGSKQQIAFSADYSVGSAVHEICHALGMIHEHCRPDRDSYVIVNSSNIQLFNLSQFSKYSSSEATGCGLFDFGSIMMYDSWAFANNTTNPSMTTLGGNTFGCQRDHLSQGDIACLQRLYGPPYVKISSSRVILQDVVYGIDEIFEYRDAYSLTFYSDQNCTNQVALPYDRVVTVQINRVYYDSFTGDIESIKYWENYTIPSGTYSYDLGSYLNKQNYTMSNPNMTYDVYELELF